ncbi:uncharacterized protein [Clytia hemisphaerica]|uniref:uncharacterized protein n=1 Tax=Clytia hemisphaerica TaxID=252671 RepID=UPI0034D64911
MHGETQSSAPCGKVKDRKTTLPNIGSTVCKIVVNIILDRLRPWYEVQLSEEQNGFRKDRGTTDGIYSIKRVQQIAHRKKQPLYLLFIDLTAAFDHIPRKWLFDSIKLRFTENNPPQLLNILEKLYENTSLTFEGETFQTTSGVLQGGPESSFLFNLFIDFVMRVFIEKSEGINFFDHKYQINPFSFTREEKYILRRHHTDLNGSSDFAWCGYADDLVLFLVNLVSLQDTANLLDEVFQNFGLTINKSKTETMILNHDILGVDEYPKSIVSINDTPLNNVPKFKYLGCYIDYLDPNTGDAEINHRIQMASVKFSQMSNLLQNFHINLKTRVKFLNSFIRSRLTYSCQNWNINQKQFDRIDTAYRTFLRRMVRNGMKHVNEKENDFRMVISNARLLEICGTKDVSLFIKSQQSKYIAHVIRMCIDRNVKRLTFNDDKYTRKGRPVKSLLECVMVNENVSVDGFCNLALQRKK